jgi:vanillate/3-O-methylgallate O-demethylase
MHETLAEAIDRCGGAVPLLRDAPGRPTVFPLAPEFSNWRSEQRAWRDGCALLDQSHHMTDLFVKGPDALRALSRLAVNSFEGFAVDRAKQLVAVNHDGFVIGDGILFHLAPDSFDLVGHRMVIDWVQFNLETGDYDLGFERDDDSLVREGPPRLYRYELQGPTAPAIVERLTGVPPPELEFFSMCTLAIAGLEVRALRHGMAGRPGFELFGPWEEGARLREALLDAGDGLGLVAAGSPCRRSSPETRCRPTASGCLLRARDRSGGASAPTIPPTIT